MASGRSCNSDNAERAARVWRPLRGLLGGTPPGVEESDGDGGLVVAAVLNALYSVVPSAEKMLPPTFCVVLTAERKVNGAPALFCCATKASVAVSYMVNPAMKRRPSGDIEITVLCPAVVPRNTCPCRRVIVYEIEGTGAESNAQHRPR